MTINN